MLVITSQQKSEQRNSMLLQEGKIKILPRLRIQYPIITYDSGARLWVQVPALHSFFFKILFIYSWETQKRGRDTGREAGSLWGARCVIWPQDSRITPLAEGRGSTSEPPRHPPSSAFRSWMPLGKWHHLPHALPKWEREQRAPSRLAVRIKWVSIYTAWQEYPGHRGCFWVLAMISSSNW